MPFDSGWVLGALGGTIPDLDILLYDNILCDTERLTIPHPRMAERAFVLLPLADINRDLPLPSGKTVGQLLANCSVQGIVKSTAEKYNY